MSWTHVVPTSLVHHMTTPMSHYTATLGATRHPKLDIKSSDVASFTLNLAGNVNDAPLGTVHIARMTSTYVAIECGASLFLQDPAPELVLR